MIDDFTCGSTGPIMTYSSRGYIVVTNSWMGNSTTWGTQNFNSPRYFDPPKIESQFRDADIDLILKRHGRALSNAEKSVIRRFNRPPTIKGIRTCEKQHGRALKSAEDVPGLQARFDRRIPCWRAGRWKSLT